LKLTISILSVQSSSSSRFLFKWNKRNNELLILNCVYLRASNYYCFLLMKKQPYPKWFWVCKRYLLEQ
jgi:hypothetical protein